MCQAYCMCSGSMARACRAMSPVVIPEGLAALPRCEILKSLKERHPFYLLTFGICLMRAFSSRLLG